jgi:uncharacterized protein
LTLLYLDTSALIRLYTEEPHREAVRDETQRASGVVCHAITLVEVASALTGRRARKLMSVRAYNTALAAFDTDWATFRHVALDDELLQAASTLARTHALRAYDAVHLAAAQAVAPLGVQFMTFDVKLRAVAEQVLLGAVWQE